MSVYVVILYIGADVRVYFIYAHVFLQYVLLILNDF